MNEEEIEIMIIKSWRNDEIIDLYKEGGWWKDQYDESSIDQLILGSYLFVLALSKKRKNPIGMGRILSDGISDAYIQDLVVKKKYRNKGVGKRIVRFLVEYCLSNGIKWISLISEPNQDSFYVKLGFEYMKNYIPMKYQIED
jgi:ribosomal protein S18 acetylase RimI-like enzyme